MIVRIFRVRVREGQAASWQKMVEEHSIPWMKEQSGCLEFYPGRPIDAEGLEFSMTSIWTGRDAIEAAVGKNWQEAILFGKEAELVESVEMHHYEVFGQDD